MAETPRREKQHVVLCGYWFTGTNTDRTFCGPGSIMLLPRIAAGKAAPSSTLETRSSSSFTHGRVSSIVPPVNSLIARASASAHSPEPSKTRPHCALLRLKGYTRFVYSSPICSCSVRVASIKGRLQQGLLFIVQSSCRVLFKGSARLQQGLLFTVQAFFSRAT